MIKLLLATDGSKNSFRITDHVLKLAEQGLNLQVPVISVVAFTKDMAEYLGVQKDSYQDAIQTRLAPVFDKYREAMQDHGNIQLEFLVAQGDVAQKIVDVANSGQYDMILVGRRGLSAVKEIFLGSASRKIIQLAKCPVLVVK